MSEPTPQQMAGDLTTWMERIERKVSGLDLCIQPIHNRLNAQLKVIEELQEESRHLRGAGMKVEEESRENYCALSKRLDALEAEILHCVRTDYVDGLARRVAGLESQARPAQEDGHLAGSFCEHGFRREDDPQWQPGMAQCAQCAVPDADIDASLVARYMAERDAAIARADEAERERDEARSEIRGHERTYQIVAGDRARAERERDEFLRERNIARNEWSELRKYVKHHEQCAFSMSTGDCTCGLTQALVDGSGQHE